jgi:hypothetical protein
MADLVALVIWNLFVTSYRDIETIEPLRTTRLAERSKPACFRHVWLATNSLKGGNEGRESVFRNDNIITEDNDLTA